MDCCLTGSLLLQINWLIDWLKKNRFRTELRQHFFSERVINIWNKLKKDTVCAFSLNSFKHHLQKSYQDGSFHRLLQSIWPKRLSQFPLGRPRLVSNLVSKRIRFLTEPFGFKALGLRLVDNFSHNQSGSITALMVSHNLSLHRFRFPNSAIRHPCPSCPRSWWHVLQC